MVALNSSHLPTHHHQIVLGFSNASDTSSPFGHFPITGRPSVDYSMPSPLLSPSLSFLNLKIGSYDTSSPCLMTPLVPQGGTTKHSNLEPFLTLLYSIATSSTNMLQPQFSIPVSSLLLSFSLFQIIYLSSINTTLIFIRY